MAASTGFREEYRMIIGFKFWGWFFGWGIGSTKGNYGDVSFDLDLVYKYEDDPIFSVIGFWHTHPPNVGAGPSMTDHATMHGLVNSLGRSLLCAISCKKVLMGWWYKEDRFFDDKDIEQSCVVNKSLPIKKLGNFFCGRIQTY